jgi:hypothetical protein
LGVHHCIVWPEHAVQQLVRQQVEGVAHGTH